MTTRQDLIDERDRLREERDALLEEREDSFFDRGPEHHDPLDKRHGRDKSSRLGKVLVALLVVAVIAVIAFFALGGSVDFDSEGDLEVPDVDMDVNPPDLAVDIEETPPASAEAADGQGRACGPPSGGVWWTG